jgi:hypothetical protein
MEIDFTNEQCAPHETTISTIERFIHLKESHPDAYHQ